MPVLYKRQHKSQDLRMSNWINYHHLLYFKTIAEQSSISKAADLLRLGQPTLSAQLKQFEDNLGVKLFERKNKKLILTEQGQIALTYAQNIFSMGNEMYQVLHDKIIPTKVHFHIGALDDIPKQIVFQIAKFSYAKLPCYLTMTEGGSVELMQLLSTHNLDLVISNYLPSTIDLKNTKYKSISKKNVNFYGSQKYKQLRKGFPQSLKEQKIILPTYESKMRIEFDQWCETHKIWLDVVAETQDVSLKKMMACEGFGLITAASHSVQKQVLSGELIEIGPLAGASEELFLISSKRQNENEVLKLVLEEFKI